MDAKFKATRIKWDVDKEDVEESFSLCFAIYRGKIYK